MPGIPAKTVHFPPRRDGVPAPHASLAALIVSTSRESAGNSCENGSLSPAAGCGTGSTCLSRRTWHFHLRGKCRVFRRKRFTFPRGGMGYRLHMPLWRHLPFPPPGKCRTFPRKRFTFPRGGMGYRLHMPLWRHLPFPPPGKCREFLRKRFTFPDNVINTWFFLERRKIVRILGYH